jgi:hypothetical protein
MKRIVGIALIVLLCLAPTLAWAATRAAGGENPPAAKPPPGVELAQTISLITGVAISPLLGVGAVGAWQYAHARAEERRRLPWFAHPLFWAPALLLVAAVFAKDVLGPSVPTTLKKPFDLAELFENKVSALIATGAFIPLVISSFSTAANDPSAALGTQGLAVLDAAAWGKALLLPFAMATFLMVWLAAHAVNVLIMLSPFATLDALLKSGRLALLASVTATSFANPYVGAAWSLGIIVMSYFLAGWSFRMSVFGSVFAWDILTCRRKRVAPEPQGQRAFLGSPIGRVPVRTMGVLRETAPGEIEFAYHPWLVLPLRTVKLPLGSYIVGRSLFHPELIRPAGEARITMVKFPPRFRTHEDALAKLYGVEVEDTGVLAAWRWVKELLGLRAASAAS